MDNLKDKTAIVIGAHTKCGGAVVRHLLEEKYHVIGVAPYLKSLQELRLQFAVNQRDRFHTRECDLYSLNSIRMTLLWIRRHFVEIDLFMYPTMQDLNGEGPNIIDINHSGGIKMLLDGLSNRCMIKCGYAKEILSKIPYDLNRKEILELNSKLLECIAEKITLK